MSGHEDWKTRQQRLHDEIERFSRSEIDLRETWLPPAMARTGFPDLTEMREAAAAASLAAERDANAAPPATGVLARAAEKRVEDAERLGLLEQRQRVIGIALELAYGYLRELCEQLNVLQPAYPEPYFLFDQLTIDGLQWIDGRADYRRVEGASDERPFERVDLRCALAGPEPLVIERPHPGMDRLRHILHDYNLGFELQELHNDRGHVDHGRFTIRREVRAGLQFVARQATEDIVLRTINIRRFGTAEYRVPVDGLTTATLEEAALLLLGESGQFLRRFERIA
jgi:hypothetical protein